MTGRRAARGSVLRGLRRWWERQQQPAQVRPRARHAQNPEPGRHPGTNPIRKEGH